MRLGGRVWCVGDDVNTDLILPVAARALPREQRPRHMFSANRPGWSAEVRPGDVLVAGRNFGMGSGRPAAQVMRDLGLACLLADSLNGLFFRNCVNYAFPALECPGVRAAFEEGDDAEIDFEPGIVRSVRSGVTLRAAPWPAAALRILRAGGLIEHLDAAGLLYPEGWMPASGPDGETRCA